MAWPDPTHKDQQKPVVQQQRVTIHNTHGEKLVGIMHETGSTEVVIICHGFKSSKGELISGTLCPQNLQDRIPMVNLALALGKESISAFRFDFAGNGESDGVFRYGSYRREANDLRDVVQYFYRKNRSIAAIIGHSKGGNAVLLYASTYNDVSIIVNISGRLDLKRGIDGRLGNDFLERIKQHGFIDVKNRRGKVDYRVTEESLTDRLTTDMHGACLSIPNSCRVLTIHGSMDEMVPVEDAYEFNKCISNHKLRIIEGADHEFTSHQDELTSIVLDFTTVNPYHDKEMPTRFRPCTRGEKFIHSRF